MNIMKFYCAILLTIEILVKLKIITNFALYIKTTALVLMAYSDLIIYTSI